MQDSKNGEEDRIRLLENWLPLAHSENMRHGWNLNSFELEQLVLSALSALDRVASILGARAVLWRHHQLIHEEDL